MFAHVQKEIVELLDCSPAGIGNLPGEVFSSGIEALSKGDLYIAGLNPGGGVSYPSLHNHVRDWSWSNYSAFIDQCWKQSCWDADCYGMQRNSNCACTRGTDSHQRAVQRMVARADLGLDLRKVFATNAVFVKSNSGDSFYEETGLTLKDAFENCWPIHELLLSIVWPRAILSLGYQIGKSAYSFFKTKATQVGKEGSFTVAGRTFPSFRWAQMTFDVRGRTMRCLVVGIRHPSYVPDAADCPEFTSLLANGELPTKIADRPFPTFDVPVSSLVVPSVAAASAALKEASNAASLQVGHGAATDVVPLSTERSYKSRIRGHITVTLLSGHVSSARAFEKMERDCVPKRLAVTGILDGRPYRFPCSSNPGRRKVTSYCNYFESGGQWLFFYTNEAILPKGASVEFIPDIRKSQYQAVLHA
jgi:hypothetical protein